MDRNEAIEIVREYYPSSGKDLNEALETLIPELKESEDEMTRKALLVFVKDAKQSLELQERDNNKLEIVLLERYIAWLEKQSEQNPKSADFIPIDCTSDAKYENRWHKVEDSLPDDAREVLCKDAIGNFFIGRYYNDGDYWEVSMYDEPDKSNKDNPSVLMWANIPLCEQNLANSGKTCKDEPKFKVGDWVISTITKEVEQVIELTDCEYICSGHLIVSFNNQHLLKRWSIQDAKDGDVLCTYECGGRKIVFILKGTPKKYYALSYYCYYNIMYPHFDFNSDSGCLAPSDENVKPATEEQRDLLFQKMKEAGYEWDAEKKELKKVEQKSAWSEEDEEMFNSIIHFSE